MQIAIIFMCLMRVVSLLLRMSCGWLFDGNFIAWATRTLIVRKLKGLEDIIREHRKSSQRTITR